MPEEYSNERVVIAHMAENATEALVIRGLLQSKGIHGNGHMVMIEKNNLAIAKVIDDWVVKNVK